MTTRFEESVVELMLDLKKEAAPHEKGASEILRILFATGTYSQIMHALAVQAIDHKMEDLDVIIGLQKFFTYMVGEIAVTTFDSTKYTEASTTLAGMYNTDLLNQLEARQMMREAKKAAKG